MYILRFKKWRKCKLEKLRLEYENDRLSKLSKLRNAAAKSNLARLYENKIKGKTGNIKYM